MPELPEVETLCRQLAECISGEEIISIEVLDSRIGKIDFPEKARISGISRIGKWFTIDLENGESLLFHLRMTGRLFYSLQSNLPEHTRLILNFKGFRILLVDPRRFAAVTLKKSSCNLHTGKDALSCSSADFLFKAARKRSVSIKNFLLDQSKLSGIGNIYACEILYSAGINPSRSVSSLSLHEWSALLKSMKTILKKAVSSRGTSVSDWRDLFGEKGDYQNFLKVYKQEGKNCIRCGNIIKRMKQNGRSTFVCSCCQK
jgi:formamidopyrimidine-DNA glycosylase